MSNPYLPAGVTQRDIDRAAGEGGLTEDDLCKNCGNELFEGKVVNGKWGTFCRTCGHEWMKEEV